jgi:hypothetical protein
MRHSAYSKYYDAYKLFEKKLEKNKKKKKFENFTYTLHEKNSACLEYCYCVGEM